jgi:hypothetical protein
MPLYIPTVTPHVEPGAVQTIIDGMGAIVVRGVVSMRVLNQCKTFVPIPRMEGVYTPRHSTRLDEVIRRLSSLDGVRAAFDAAWGEECVLVDHGRGILSLPETQGMGYVMRAILGSFPMPTQPTSHAFFPHRPDGEGPPFFIQGYVPLTTTTPGSGHLTLSPGSHLGAEADILTVPIHEGDLLLYRTDLQVGYDALSHSTHPTIGVFFRMTPSFHLPQPLYKPHHTKKTPSLGLAGLAPIGLPID